MPRTEVYQLRLTPEEKAELASVAALNNGSIANLIRETFGLGDRSHRKVSIPFDGSHSGKTTQGDTADLKGYKKLVAQLQARMPLQEAEDEARKRLGMK